MSSSDTCGQRLHAEKEAFVRISRGLLDEPGQDLKADGRRLIVACREALQWHEAYGRRKEREDRENYPPALLVLLVSPAFRGADSAAPFRELMEGITEERASLGLTADKRPVPLIGCSVAGVLTEEKDMPKGAALVCIASRLIRARVAAARDALDHPQEAAQELCRQLDLTGKDLNPHGNRYLLCFLPGYIQDGGHLRYEAPTIHSALRKQTRGRLSMVGGVAADEYGKHECSWQFAEGMVDSRTAVVALVESELRFGIGMMHGLTPTEEFLYASEFSKEDRTIGRLARICQGQFEDRGAAEVVEQYRKAKRTLFLAAVAPEEEGDRIVLFPRVNPDGSGSVLVNRWTEPEYPMEILTCEEERLRNTPAETIRCTLESAGIDPYHLACALRFPCAARHRYAKEIGLDVPGALGEMKRWFPEVPIVAGLMSGELGQTMRGIPVVRNWTVSNLLIADEFHPRSLHRLGYEAAVEIGQRVHADESLSKVVSDSLDALTQAGFPGAMISLVFQDRASYVIVAQDARGTGWRRIVEPTKRRSTGRDILVEVKKTGKPQFIQDARIGEFDDQTAVREAGVISYYVLPLTAPDGEVIGAIQVDLGDMSHLGSPPEYLETLLQAFSGQIAISISRVIEVQERRLSKLFDQAVEASLVEPTVAKAAQTFVNHIMSRPDLLASHMVHVRLAVQEDRFLELVAGAGPYYEEARRYRDIVPVEDRPTASPTAKAFARRQSTWVNEAKSDADAEAFLKNLANPSLGKSLAGMRSYANLLIPGSDPDHPMGVITIASPQEWFFSRSICRSMQTLGERLSVALKHAEQVEREDRRAQEIEFLLDMTPQLGADDLRDALKRHARLVAEVAEADVVSFFLWDEETERLVLRGQFGWKDKQMIGRAWYGLGDGMTGTAAKEMLTRHIPDVRAWRASKDLSGPGKYEQEMFGDRSENARYEAIVISLGVQRASGEGRPLGILTLQNALPSQGASTRFSTVDQKLLDDVRHDFTAFLMASLARQRPEHRHEAEKRIGEFTKFLLRPVADRYDLTRRVCHYLADRYNLQGCAIYVPGSARGLLRLAGPAAIVRPQGMKAEMLDEYPDVRMEDTPFWRVFTSGKRFNWRRAPEADIPLDAPICAAVPFLCEQKTQAVLAEPLAELGRPPVGVLLAWNIRAREGEEYPWFTKRDCAEFRRVAECLARALDKGQLSRRAQMLLFMGELRTDLLHFVGNVGAAIQNEADFLRRTDSDAQTKEIARSIAETARRLVEERDRCLTAGEAAEHARYGETELGSVLHEAMERCRAKAEANDLGLELTCCQSVLVRGDSVQLTHLFANIIDNGLNSMSEGTLRVEMLLGPGPQEVQVRVIDCGKGMSKEEIQQLYSSSEHVAPDRRVHLGFDLARFICERHGGRMQHKGLPGNGTRGVVVTIVLPYVRT